MIPFYTPSPSLYFISLSPPAWYRATPTYIAIGCLGSAVSYSSGSVRSPATKRFLVHSTPKLTLLVTKMFNIFKDFCQTEIRIFIAPGDST